MQRIAFVMRVKEGQEAEYRRRHEAVWPAMLRALKKAGSSNYSIYMKGRDLFAYMEVEDFDGFQRMMSADSDAQRWEAQMASSASATTDVTSRLPISAISRVALAK